MRADAAPLGRDARARPFASMVHLVTRSQTGDRTGVCLWLTGLSGAGKSTTARAVGAPLRKRGHQVTLFDGDEFRARVSTDLGFSKADRDTNVMRVASLARDVVERGEIVICALVSPYGGTRDRARQLIGGHKFLEVFVDAPLALCEARDTKGLYARARRGELTGLTGVDDPYEAPISPDLVVRTTDGTVEHNVRLVLELLAARKFL